MGRRMFTHLSFCCTLHRRSPFWKPAQDCRSIAALSQVRFLVFFRSSAFVKIVVPWAQIKKTNEAVCGSLSFTQHLFMLLVPRTRRKMSVTSAFGWCFVLLFFVWLRARSRASLSNKDTWLILPVVICLSQRLSHACLSTYLTKVKPRMAH